MNISYKETEKGVKLLIDIDGFLLHENVDDNGKIEESVIEHLITTAFDFSRFNNRSDVETVKLIMDSFLNNFERESVKHFL